MKHIATYLLLVLGGNKSPSVADVKKALEAVGVECDDDRLSKLINEMDGKSLDEVLAAGKDMLASFGGGGGGGGYSPAAIMSRVPGLPSIIMF